MSRRKIFPPIITGFLLTPVCLFAAIVSAGGGHGNYFWAKVFFPYTMLSWSPKLTAPFEVLAIVQMPLYGVVLGIAWHKGRLPLCVVVLGVLHGFAVWLCFTEALWRRWWN
jgi:xanthine/uracil permease